MHPQLMIVGGGIGGISAALALHRAGVEIRVFEQAPVFTEIGAGLSLWPNATRILQSLGVLDRVLELGEPVTQFNLHRPDGSTLATIPMGGYPTPALCIHRADLHQALREPLPAICLESNQRLQSFTQEVGRVTGRFTSGLEAHADGLIGADGIKSLIRTQLHGKG
jgi:2-polyprenyl-6-methoxyphenol hydroxylase-like FAD-dependent oxidoreductase